MDRNEIQLYSPFDYISRMPGKNVRGNLAKAFNFWLKLDEELLKKIVNIVEMLHNASLMIDDIEDNSILRRGLPVTHSIYGIARTINTANFIYFKALSSCLELGNRRAVDVFTAQLIELHRGQGKDIYWREVQQCPTEAEYEEMVVQKTGGLFRIAVQLMEMFSEFSYGFSSLVDYLALYFQIRDDYINLCSEEYAEKKSFAEDLTEGKFSFPVIAAVNRNDPDDEILNILRQRTVDRDVKKYCIKLIGERGAFKYTLNRIEHYKSQIFKETLKHGTNDLLIKLVEKLNEAFSEKIV